MTKTATIFAILGGIVGIGLVVWLAAPLFYNKRVNEELPVGAATVTASKQPAAPLTTVVGEAPSDSIAPAVGTVTVLTSGQFQGADSFHQASGEARLVTIDGKTYVRFEDNFSVTNGPDLYVYFGNNGKYDANTNIGRLKGNVGSQNYEVPANINVNDYNEVWVWCRTFSVPFGHAVLH